MKSTALKGYLFALVATIAFSNVYIFSKAAMNEVHLSQFGLYWFGISFLATFIYVVLSGKIRQLSLFSRKQWITLGLLGLLEIATNTSFYLSIHVIPDPAVTSFLGNLYPVCMVLFGVLFLKERLTVVETMGALLALAGAFVISYTGGTSLGDLFIPGTGIVVINAILASSASLVVKVNVKNIEPELLVMNYTLWLTLFSLGMFFYFGMPLAIPATALTNIAIGALLGPCLAVIAIYYSFKFLEASKSSIVQSSRGIFVLLGAWLYFGTFPQGHQLMGGLLTVAGVLVMTLGKVLPFGKVKKA